MIKYSKIGSLYKLNRDHYFKNLNYSYMSQNPNEKKYYLLIRENAIVLVIKEERRSYFNRIYFLANKEKYYYDCILEYNFKDLFRSLST